MEHLTVSQAAEALGLSVPTIKRYVYDGKLKSAKLPGGQLRIPRSEIDRVLSAGTQPAVPGRSDGGEEPSLADRLTVVESWLTELQADVDRLSGALEIIAAHCARTAAPAAETESTSNACGCSYQILVLGPGCKRCDTLYELTLRVLQAGGFRDFCVERVKNIADIAGFGPVVTPALVVNNKLVVSGRVSTEPALREALYRHLN